MHTHTHTLHQKQVLEAGTVQLIPGLCFRKKGEREKASESPQLETCGSSKGFRTEFSSSELSLLLLSRRCRDDDDSIGPVAAEQTKITNNSFNPLATS